MRKNKKTGLIRWGRLLDKKWVILFLTLLTISLIAAWFHISEIKRQHKVIIRLPLTVDGQPIRPVSEFALWLNESANEHAGFEIAWRSFIASKRFEGQDRRVAVVAATVQIPRGFELSHADLEQQINTLALNLVQGAESAIAGTADRKAVDSIVIWSQRRDDQRYIAWIALLAALFSSAATLNLFVFASSIRSMIARNTSE